LYHFDRIAWLVLMKPGLDKVQHAIRAWFFCNPTDGRKPEIVWIGVMRELITAIKSSLDQEKPCALATVVRTWGSSPRGVGSKMLIGPDGEMTGSVSGGCVEAAVAAAGMEVIQTGISQYLHYGVADETAWDVGLACGGKIDVFVQLLNKGVGHTLQSAWEEGLPVVRALVVRGPETLVGLELVLMPGGGYFPQGMSGIAVETELLAREALTRRCSGNETFTSQTHGAVEIFLDVILPGETIVVVGGVHLATYLVRFAHVMGYRTVVIDPRKKFANQDRFPDADEIIQAWPQKAFEHLQLTHNTAAAILTHDPKIDDPALKIVLASPAYYVGALGSRKTQSERRKRLLESGVTEADLDRLRGPIGLDLGGRAPAEIALSIIAEIVQMKHANQ
jgi:xanthine dehydrogenase accessory factor